MNLVCIECERWEMINLNEIFLFFQYFSEPEIERLVNLAKLALESGIHDVADKAENEPLLIKINEYIKARR
jgi:hypothetical protein